MAVYLDEPLPDEILFSVIARYVENAGIENVAEFLKILMGNGMYQPGEVDPFAHLADETSRAWGMSARDISDRLTLVPFYAAIFPGKGRIVAVLKRLRCAPWSGYIASGKPGIRYCEACWREDDGNNFPRYWRRTHQIPGVVVCPWHRCVLLGMGSTYTRTLLRAAALRDGGNPVVAGSLEEAEEWCTVAILASQLLCGDARWSRFGGEGPCMSMARRCGYVVERKIDSARLAGDLSERLGNGYLVAVNLSRDLAVELQRALDLPDDRACSPLSALLLGYLLLDVGNRLSIPAVPDCPGSRPRGDSRHRVVAWPSRNGLSHYLCSCGLSFVIEHDEHGAVLQYTQEGADIALAAAILLGRSFTVHKVISMLGVPAHALEEMRFRRAEIRWWSRRTERAGKLVQWIELVDRAGCPDRAYAVGAHIFHALGQLTEVLPPAATPGNARAFSRQRRVRGER
ncbi:TniQ family protein [Paraburkholderia flagellata]|uniref:TniQ family protein n=1 Tax=Paraburkholderia flagellata TaxID=2883241 RepID=UPI001F3E7D30|nr:TniQ family protein [Paraburkholderia flagellata]